MKLLLVFLLFFLAQVLIWVQTNGQFIWPLFKKNPLLISFGFGGIISYILIQVTRLVVEHFDGLLWPGRFIGFASGILIFSIMTYFLMGEGINTKTGLSLILAIGLICIQLFWK